MAESPLDLAAVQQQLGRQLTHAERCYEAGAGCVCGSAQALAETFAVLRATRAALREMLDLNYKWSPTREGESTRSSRAAAVLRGVQDQEG